MNSKLTFWWDAWCWLIGEQLVRLTRQLLPKRAIPLDADRFWEGAFAFPAVRRDLLEGQIVERLMNESPLAPERALVGWRIEPDWQGWRVVWVVADRDAVKAVRRAAAAPDGVVVARVSETEIPFRDEVWHQTERRRRKEGRWALGAVTLLLLLWVIALLVTPWQERQATKRAVAFAQELERRVQPVQSALAALRAAEARVLALQQVASVQRDWVAAWEMVSRLLPDGAWLDRWEQQGTQVRIVGVTPSVAQFLAALAKEPGVAEVRTPLATTRDSRTGFERFTVEFQWQRALEGQRE